MSQARTITRKQAPSQSAPPSQRIRRLAWAPGLIQACLFGILLVVGGGLYEAVVVDPAWPSQLALIQPESGGINRKLFWIPLHAALTLLFPATLWAAWPRRALRPPLLGAAALYVAMRDWSGLYFIPTALQFEVEPELTAALASEARAWVLLSLLRTPLVLASAAALWRAAAVCTSQTGVARG
jgi:hypothetical protein